MNEKRLQEYLELIKKLLSCSTDEEINQILVENKNLLNVGFLQTVATEIEKALNEGDESRANRLRYLFNARDKALNSSPNVPTTSPTVNVEQNLESLSEEEIEAYLQFLLQVLQAIERSQGDAQVVYPLLATNIDKLDANLAEVLRRWATSIFKETEASKVESIAIDIGNFSNLIGDFPLGNKASNMEIAITGCEVILTIFTKDASPEVWAGTQNNLGIAYINRIKGHKADNIEKAIAAYNAALGIYTPKDFPQDWAGTQNNLGIAYKERIKGDKADNIENAIASFEAALEVYTRNDFPQDWAGTQNNLGSAYRNRIKGDKAENIEKAIVAYNATLEIRTRNDFPQNWAMTQHNLGNAYRDRIRGDKPDNLEKAIAAYNAALKVYTRNHFPQYWALTQNNLGAAYSDRIKEDKAENIEKAIASFEAALEVYTRNDFPQDWAMTQNNLGAAYSDRIKEDKAENIEKAIASFEAGLEIRTRNDFPQYWATTQNNLGNAYSDRIKGDKAENIEKAIASFEAALEVYTRDDFPQYWATTQNNLGAAYSDRIKEDKAENIEKAIASFEAGLEIRTRNDFPQYWATTQNNLGNAYSDRIKGDKAENIEKAIASFEAGLEIRTRNDFPQNWAMMQHNLGNAYRDRIKGHKADNIEQAINNYQDALTVLIPAALPIDCLKTARNLGNLLLKIERWKEAINAYDKAIQAVELTRSWAAYDSRRQEILEDAFSVYANIIQACINNKQPALAIEYAERSKARNLIELLANRDLYPKGDISQQIIDKLDRLRKEIRVEQTYLSRQTKSQIQGANKDENQIKAENQKWEESRQHLEQLQQQLDELITNQIQPIDSSFSLTQKVESIKFKEIQSLLDERTAIIEWYITTDKIIAFLTTPKPPVLFFGRRGANVNVWQSQPEDLGALNDWTNEYLREYYNENKKSQWQKKLDERLKKLAEILHIDELIAQIPKDCDKLILIPHQLLHIFPLHALEVKSDEISIKKCLFELFPGGVKYAPSCQLLQLAETQQINDFTSLFAIQEPKNHFSSLPFANIEVEVIRSFFSNADILTEEKATLSALINNKNRESAHCIHFSCHGDFNVEQPLESAVFLANNDSLTLGNLFARDLDLNQCHLVVLSACETGLIDANNISDEYIGLPSGFLFAGSSSVISSQWTVDDFATTFLLIKFYSNLRNISKIGEGDVALALKDAQIWLRNLKSEEGEKFLLEKIIPHIDEIFSNKPRTANSLKQAAYSRIKKDTYPFANPFYWAAFIATGF